MVALHYDALLQHRILNANLLILANAHQIVQVVLVQVAAVLLADTNV